MKASFETLQHRIANRERQISASRSLILAGADEYANALDANRLEAWAKMMHSVIELLSAIDRPLQTNADAEQIASRL